jgi:hypothetical protein
MFGMRGSGADLDTLALDVPLGLVKQRFEVGDLPLELNLFDGE